MGQPRLWGIMVINLMAFVVLNARRIAVKLSTVMGVGWRIS